MTMSRQLGPGLERAPGSGWHPTELAHHTRLTGGRSPARDKGSTGGFGGNIAVLIGVVVILSAIDLAARHAPIMLVPLLVIGLVFILKAMGQRVSRPWDLFRAPRPAGDAGLPPARSEAELVQWVGGLLGSFQYQFQRIEPLGQPARPGIDLIWRDPDGQLIVVRCQSNGPSDTVGFLDILGLLEAVIQERAAGGIFVTTTSFTQAAITFTGYSPLPIDLYDGTALDRLPARPEWAGTAA